MYTKHSPTKITTAFHSSIPKPVSAKPIFAILIEVHFRKSLGREVGRSGIKRGAAPSVKDGVQSLDDPYGGPAGPDHADCGRQALGQAWKQRAATCHEYGARQPVFQGRVGGRKPPDGDPGHLVQPCLVDPDPVGSQQDLGAPEPLYPENDLEIFLRQRAGPRRLARLRGSAFCLRSNKTGVHFLH